ncbi:MAG: hypothetical protein HOP08_00710 [Cyclobacteriaceae bacterium]|nr:hypothetical protein [Cyclobacteriaceae bacterium]
MNKMLQNHDNRPAMFGGASNVFRPGKLLAPLHHFVPVITVYLYGKA